MAGKVDPARLVAYDVLRAVHAQDAYANLALPALLRERSVTGRDAALATELVGGTLRGLGTYDAVLAAVVDRPPDDEVRDALRLGVHQLLATRVPSHAAVATTVDLVRRRVGHRPSGFVNAVLRKVGAHDLDGWLRRVAPDPDADPVGHAAVVHSHPRWVVERLAEALGERGDELDALLAADNDRPAVTLVARPGLSDVAELPGTPSISPLGVVLEGGDPGEVAAVREGRAGVQDAGSQLVALALARTEVEGPDRAWLDLCAGPGGKAALLGALASQCGARLVAAERQPHRARLVARAVGTTAGVVTADGARPPWAAGRFDRVLVDAPCTGLGALRRRPEARWRRTPDDLSALVPLQRALLESALDSTRPGGVVAYATCSPVVEETAGVVREVLAGRDDVDLADAVPLVPEAVDAAGVHLPGTVQLWPHRHGTDAMFLAVLRRL
ncbi:rRNA cytosine-C5-methyltransferase [Marmoricola endophyticus]|uniref:rRNA cytosine-C5-methyltransferase n=1 Tax=Marmoricola endophyticus TaxID=2040280 RepID=A0A917BBB2_9ACTN|nr:transcription antitermination factor NusB [Marmoricola endophyticus]GGF35732.1 rRNA cytosine-C5-methyltransferase [Marmoricola endophyticus]